MKVAHNRISQNDFIRRSKKLHGNKYDYTVSRFNGWDNAVSIICPIHGMFIQTGGSHLKGSGCKKCSYIENANRCRNTLDMFLQKASAVHRNIYDYSKVKYINNRTKVCVICSKHGEFWVNPDNHIHRKVGCKLCSFKCKTYTTEEYIAKFRETHGDLYDYSQTDYKGSNKKLIIVCKKHGPFSQIADSHMRGKGCQRCIRKQEYKLEVKIRQYFKEWTIKPQEKIYSDVHERTRTFDFVLRRNDKKIIIEYDGKQHYQPVRFSYKMTAAQAEKVYVKQVETDRLDIEFCKNMGYLLFRVKYNENFEEACKKIRSLV